MGKSPSISTTVQEPNGFAPGIDQLYCIFRVQRGLAYSLGGCLTLRAGYPRRCETAPGESDCRNGREAAEAVSRLLMVQGRGQALPALRMTCMHRIVCMSRGRRTTERKRQILAMWTNCAGTK